MLVKKAIFDLSDEPEVRYNIRGMRLSSTGKTLPKSRQCWCTERDDLRGAPCPIHDSGNPPTWTDADNRAMKYRDTHLPYCEANHANCSGDPFADDWCGGVFRCGGCGEWVGWCFGCDGDMPAACDDCWSKAHKGEVLDRCCKCNDPYTDDEGIQMIVGIGWVCPHCLPELRSPPAYKAGK